MCYNATLKKRKVKPENLILRNYCQIFGYWRRWGNFAPQGGRILFDERGKLRATAVTEGNIWFTFSPCENTGDTRLFHYFSKRIVISQPVVPVLCRYFRCPLRCICHIVCFPTIFQPCRRAKATAGERLPNTSVKP